MLKVENTSVTGWEASIRGMRNPMNSWAKSDSHACMAEFGMDCAMCENDHEPGIECNDGAFGYCIGENDLDLMMRLRRGGPDDRKYLRMLVVTADITAPLYWWKEYDTYKVGTVANSCSTMHKIHAKEFTMDDFSHEHIDETNMLWCIPDELNKWRKLYLETKDKYYWWNMIQLLPTSYNQRRTVMLNYEVLINLYHARRNHKLEEWHTLCDWILSLPYSELITGGATE